MQKKVLALHDLSGFGRSSLVPIIAVLSAGGHQCVPLPTAVFSTHTAIPNWVTTDLTSAMQGTIEQYDALGLRFEAVYAGFLGSADQIDRVREAAQRLKTPDGITLIDPVMGDNGKVYDTYTPEMCTRMRELCAIADIITPNTTEAAILMDWDPCSRPRTAEEAWEWLRALRAQYGAQVVLTGLDFEQGKVGSGCLSDTGGTLSLHRRIDRYYPGTGDLFASVMLGALLNGHSLPAACERAGEYVKDCIAYTAEQQTDPMHGVQFEKLLYKLIGEQHEA
ncbi:pyridoxamine kinase [Agathobaculum sp.]|uniref:pyridoxamine kinase n=1 Tax=Agathobaculum sp. TaxID=2048138 RepID=UPI001C3BB296|nr:pyridoxamine kinase [Agathobaculum sp.]MBS6641593.1 pyridoxamine kinase [Clostridiaceae bacterium]HIX10557.1 pyridoxamine kinase [Candidatus Agathobaculum pullistercoris]